MNETRGLWRGKTMPKYNGEEFNEVWVEGDLIHSENRYYIHPVANAVKVQSELGKLIIMHEVNPSTLGECTGLRDKNGKLIFEGDIFGFNDEVWSSCYTSGGTEWNSWDVENYGVVGFDEEYARFDFVKYKFGENSVEADLHENRDIEFAEFVSNLEIIGNIHDNPELLKEEEQ